MPGPSLHVTACPAQLPCFPCRGVALRLQGRESAMQNKKNAWATTQVAHLNALDLRRLPCRIAPCGCAPGGGAAPRGPVCGARNTAVLRAPCCLSHTLPDMCRLPCRTLRCGSESTRGRWCQSACL